MNTYYANCDAATGAPLGKGITNVIVIPTEDKDESLATLILTYDKKTIACIKLPVELLKKDGQTVTVAHLWTIKQQSKSIHSSDKISDDISSARSSGTIRLLAASI